MIRMKALIAVCATLLSNLAELPAAENSLQTPGGALRKTKSREEFVRLLKDAENRDAQAQCMVAEAYFLASYEGVSKNDIEAAKWYRKAAEQGYAGAQSWLGNLYCWGRGVLKDPVEGVRYYRMAAEQGDWSAQWKLGIHYRDGEGVPQDPVEAYKWLNLALPQLSSGHAAGVTADEVGISGARARLKDQMISLAEKMSPQQIALSQRLSTEFVPRPKQPKVTKGRDGDAFESPKSTGSGFFISDDGSLVTNFHVVEGASRVVVKTKQGSFSAKVVKLDPVNDIAVLKVAGVGFRSLPLMPSRSVKLGESMFTIGFPNPGLQGVEPKLTDGNISSLAGAQDDIRHFQISVAVQPGNSGGGLLNSVGNVVGIVTARLSDKAALDSSGALPQNVNYALKSAYVLSLLESVPELAGKLKEPWSVKERKFEDVVKEAQEAAALIVVY